MSETKLLQQDVVLPPERKVSATDCIIFILERVPQFDLIAASGRLYDPILIRRTPFSVDVAGNVILPPMPSNTRDSLWTEDISDNPADILIGQLTHL